LIITQAITAIVTKATTATNKTILVLPDRDWPDNEGSPRKSSVDSASVI
jgi:hypothetical protein